MPARRSLTLLPVLLSALLLLSASCDDEDAPAPTPVADTGVIEDASAAEDAAPEDAALEDTAADAPSGPDCTTVDPAAPGLCPTPAQSGIPAGGQDVLAAAAVAEVRLGQVTDETGGMGGVESTCKRGDFAFVNSAARFCIEGAISSNRLFFDGGRLVDAEPVGLAPSPGQTGRDRLDVLSAFVAFQVGSAREITIVRDGSDGQLAVLRVSGILEPSAYLAGIVGPELFKRRPLEVVTEYRLRPASAALEIVTFIKNTGAERQNLQGGDIVFWGDTVSPFFAGNGLLPPPAAQSILGAGAGVAYGLLYETPFSSVNIPGLSLPASPLLTPVVLLDPGQEAALRRYFVVGADVAGLLDAVNAELPEHPLAATTTEASLTVMSGAAPAPGVRVEVAPLGVDDAPGPFWVADRTDEAGLLRLRLPTGRYQAKVTGPQGQEGITTLDTAGATEATLVLPPGGVVRLNIEAFEGAGAPAPSPARVIFRQGGQPEQRVMVLRGAETATLPAGTWSWEASRGMEYTAAQGEVVVEDDGEVSVSATLERVVPTPGFVAGEFHQHATASLDSEVPVRDRVLSNIIEGVDFAVASDHDIATEFQPVIEELGATDLIGSLAGTEVSPLFGHFGAYPVRADRYLPGRGALLLAYRDADGNIGRYDNGEELIAAMRDELGAELIQSNHPRDSTGYFDSFHWNRDEPVAMADPGFSAGFDTMEIINGPECPQLQDWFALLNQGYRVVGVGNSDTHNLSSPAGFPRNYVPAPSDAPMDITERHIIDGIKSGDAVISASAWLEFGPDAPSDPNGARPGRVIPAASVTIDVRALTPPWAEVKHLVIVRNGTVVDELSIGGGEEAVVDFDGPVTLETAEGEDAWFVIIAYGDQPASAVYRGQAVFAIANPFFLDADQDGAFTAPGLLPLPTEGLPFCN